MGIQFTQFLRPDGRCKPISLEVSPDVQKLADELQAAGCRFELEVLRTGEVSMDCSRNLNPGEEVLAIEIIPNGPEVPPAVARLVAEAHRTLHRKA